MPKESITPRISIITVVFNEANLIENTLLSVFNQEYDNYEYIVIDGNSTDGTVQILEKYKHRFSTYISEPDKGLYDAMNKGIKHVKGEYVLFLNAGDLFYNSNILMYIADMAKKHNPDIIYGDTVLIDEDGAEKNLRRLRPPKNLNWKQLKYGMLICHQSFFIKSAIIDYYDLNYKYVADYDWMIRMLQRSRKNINGQIIISKFLIGGLSKKKRIQSLKERFNAMKKHYGIITTLFVHLIFIFRYLYSYMLQILKKPDSTQSPALKTPD
jgi:glycosyltransferase involved in cell wall biosynthesis